MKKILLLFVAAALPAGKAAAQLPVAGTEERPVWYYIQVLGDDARKDRVMTALNGTDVYGRAQLNAADVDGASTQLWRVETSGGKYVFVNRATGLYMDVSYDEARDISVATLSATPSCTFSLIEMQGACDGFYNIRADHAPSGGLASEVYLHQANGGGSRDYVIMMVGTDYYQEESSAFRFVEFEDFSYELSEGTEEHWYRVMSGKPALAERCIEAAPKDGASAYPYLVSEVREGADSQLWKFLARENGTVEMVNRATGEALSNTSVGDGMHNIVQPAVSLTGGADRTLEYIGSGAYLISGVEDDGILRYLNAATEGEQPDVLDRENAAGTGFAWKLRAAEPTTGVGAFAAGENAAPKVTVSGGRITVEGGAPFAVYTVEGRRVPAEGPLPAGVYVVKVGEKAVKVMLKN